MAAPPPAQKSKLSLYANLLQSSSTISSAPVVYSASNDNSNGNAADPSSDATGQKKPQISAAALRFQPQNTRRPNANANSNAQAQKAKAHAIAAKLAAAAAGSKDGSNDVQVQAGGEPANANANGKADAVQTQAQNSTTFSQWTGDMSEDEAQDILASQKRERGGRKGRNKKKNKAREHNDAFVVNWDDVYDPSRPNSYEAYKGSEEQMREIRDWKDRLYRHRYKSRGNDRSSESSDEGYRPNASFAPPKNMAFAPPKNLNEDGHRSVPPPPEETADEAYARRSALAQQFSNQNPPPPPPPPPSDSNVHPQDDAAARRAALVQKFSQQALQSKNIPPPSPPPPPPPPPMQDYDTAFDQDSENQPVAPWNPTYSPPIPQNNHQPPRPLYDEFHAPPPPPPPPQQPSSSISRAPVRYSLPSAPADLPANEAELAATLAAESEVPENTNQPRSLRPGQKGFAERIMAKYGWSKGSGLGASNEGITAPLRVQLDKQKKKGNDEAKTQQTAKIIGGKRKVEEQGKFGAMSEVVVLKGMLDGMDLRRELDEGNLMQEIGEECGDKYGRVERIFVDRQAKGSVPVFVKFTSALSALRAVNALDGRSFAGNTISAKFFDVDKFANGIYT